MPISQVSLLDYEPRIYSRRHGNGDRLELHVSIEGRKRCKKKQRTFKVRGRNGAEHTARALANRSAYDRR